eukprot:1707671-Heterocapsa_arctica.AAC.1
MGCVVGLLGGSQDLVHAPLGVRACLRPDVAAFMTDEDGSAAPFPASDKGDGSGREDASSVKRGAPVRPVAPCMVFPGEVDDAWDGLPLGGCAAAAQPVS